MPPEPQELSSLHRQCFFICCKGRGQTPVMLLTPHKEFVTLHVEMTFIGFSNWKLYILLHSLSKNAVPSEVRTTRETNQSILGPLISRLNKKSLTCYFYDGGLLEIRYFKVASHSPDDFLKGNLSFCFPFKCPLGLKKGRGKMTHILFSF